MDETNEPAEVHRKLDMILAAIEKLAKWAPRDSSSWFQEQTETGQREMPTVNQNPPARGNQSAELPL